MEILIFFIGMCAVIIAMAGVCDYIAKKY